MTDTSSNADAAGRLAAAGSAAYGDDLPDWVKDGEMPPPEIVAEMTRDYDPEKDATWHRYRFLANGDDYRPVVWPPAGPYWCSGYTTGIEDERAVLIAYLPPDADLTTYWPEAEEVEWTVETGITYTSRFQRPSWWPQ